MGLPALTSSLALRALSLIVSMAFGLACGSSSHSDDGSSENTLGGKVYQIVSNEGLTSSAEDLQGKGTVLFKDPLGEVAGSKDVALDFSVQEGGSLALIAYSDTALKNGIKITFARSGKTLTSVIEVGSQRSDERVLSTVDASGPVTLDIDVHNSETPAHILVWNRGVSSYTTSNAVLDSEVGQAVQGNGSAAFWGIALNQAGLSKTTVTEAKFAD